MGYPRGGGYPPQSSHPDGKKVLQKPPDETLFKRIRVFFGPVDWHDYTYEGDVRVNMKRRQMGDVGITAQRYSLVLYGNTQQLKIEPWEPEIQRSVTVPFEWKQDAWYRLKLRVENAGDGKRNYVCRRRCIRRRARENLARVQPRDVRRKLPIGQCAHEIPG